MLTKINIFGILVTADSNETNPIYPLEQNYIKVKYLVFVLYFWFPFGLQAQTEDIYHYYSRLYASDTLDFDARIIIYKELIDSELPIKKFIYPVLIRSYAEKKDTLNCLLYYKKALENAALITVENSEGNLDPKRLEALEFAWQSEKFKEFESQFQTYYVTGLHSLDVNLLNAVNRLYFLDQQLRIVCSPGACPNNVPVDKMYDNLRSEVHKMLDQNASVGIKQLGAYGIRKFQILLLHNYPRSKEKFDELYNRLLLEVKKGNIEPNFFAHWTDYYCVGKGLPMVYCSSALTNQAYVKDYNILPILDIENLDKRRKEIFLLPLYKAADKTSILPNNYKYDEK